MTSNNGAVCVSVGDMIVSSSAQDHEVFDWALVKVADSDTFRWIIHNDAVRTKEYIRESNFLSCRKELQRRVLLNNDLNRGGRVLL